MYKANSSKNTLEYQSYSSPTQYPYQPEYDPFNPTLTPSINQHLPNNSPKNYDSTRSISSQSRSIRNTYRSVNNNHQSSNNSCLIVYPPQLQTTHIEHILKSENQNLNEENELLKKEVTRLKQTSRKYKLRYEYCLQELQQLRCAYETQKEQTEDMKNINKELMLFLEKKIYDGNVDYMEETDQPHLSRLAKNLKGSDCDSKYEYFTSAHEARLNTAYSFSS